MTFELSTHKQAPEVCLDLQPGTNYSINISMVALNFSLLVSMTTQITGRSCHLFYIFAKAPSGCKRLSWICIVDLSVVGWVVKIFFPCSKLSIVCFHGFCRVQRQKGERIEVQIVNVSIWDIREKIVWWVGHKTTQEVSRIAELNSPPCSRLCHFLRKSSLHHGVNSSTALHMGICGNRMRYHQSLQESKVECENLHVPHTDAFASNWNSTKHKRHLSKIRFWRKSLGFTI